MGTSTQEGQQHTPRLKAVIFFIIIFIIITSTRMLSVPLILCAVMALAGANSDYGDIMKVTTTGASLPKATLAKLGVTSGLAASHAMAQADLQRMNKHKSIFIRVGRKMGIDPAIIAGIISTTSRAGKTLSSDHWGDKHKSFGLMQINVAKDGGNHKIRGAWNSEEHITQGTEILVRFIRAIQKKFPCWSKENQLKAGIMAFNSGPGNVHTCLAVDFNHFGDFGNGVVARAQWYKHHGY